MRDCIVHLITINGAGAVDAEGQVHALILPAPQVPTQLSNPGYATAPMYRFYNASTGEHFFTASQAEGVAAGFSAEGVAFNFITATGNPGTSTIYRCYNGSKHFISLDPACEGATVESTYDCSIQSGRGHPAGKSPLQFGQRGPSRNIGLH